MPRISLRRRWGSTRRRSSKPMCNAGSSGPRGASPDDHVKAPPDLIDDDVAKSEPNEMPPASPQPDTPAKKPVEPERDQYGRPKPATSVSDINYIRAARERNLAQQKKNQGGS